MTPGSSLALGEVDLLNLPDGAHAEQVVIAAAKRRGLTPTNGAASNNVCERICKPWIERFTGGWVSGEYFGIRQ
jgi:hypothetical protein